MNLCFRLLICLLLYCLGAAPITADTPEECDALLRDSIENRVAETRKDTNEALYAGNADSANAEKPKKRNLLLRIIDEFSSFDEKYIDGNHYDFMTMVQNTNMYDYYRLKATDGNGNSQYIELSPTPSFKIGPYIGWKSLFIGYAFDVRNLSNATKKSDFNLNIYTALLGFDIVYKRNSGTFNIDRISGFTNLSTNDIKDNDFKGMSVKIFALNSYYIFNHRKFSYPAAFNQSTRQIKSAGSWKAGIQYSYQTINFDYTALPEAMLHDASGEELILEGLKFKKVRYYNYSINFGYAYNWVFKRNWLLAISLTPAVSYKRLVGEDFMVKEIFKFSNLTLDLVARFGLVWNDSKHFWGVSMINNAYDYKKSKLNITNSFSWLNVYAGIYFDLPRKKK